MSNLITVFGATGIQGGSVIHTILADPDLSQKFRIRAVTRDVNKPKAKVLAEKGVEVIKGDMASVEDAEKAVDGAHTVYLVTNFWESMSANSEIVQGKIITDACKKAGVKHLIFSSLINAAKTTNGRLVNITHFDGKAEVEQYIRQSGIPSSFVMPGIYMSELPGMIQKQEDGSYVLAMPVSSKTVGPYLDAAVDTGNFVRAALNHPPAEDANVIYAASDYYSFEQIAVDFETVIGEPLNVVNVPGDVFKSFLASSLPPNMAEEIYENLVLLEDPGYYAGADLAGSLALLSEKPVDIKGFFAKNKERWC